MKPSKTRLIYAEIFSKGKDGCTCNFGVIGIYRKWSDKLYKAIYNYITPLRKVYSGIDIDWLMNDMIDANLPMELFNPENFHWKYSMKWTNPNDDEFVFIVRIHSCMVTCLNKICITHLYLNENNKEDKPSQENNKYNSTLADAMFDNMHKEIKYNN